MLVFVFLRIDKIVLESQLTQFTHAGLQVITCEIPCHSSYHLYRYEKFPSKTADVAEYTRQYVQYIVFL